MTDTAMGPTTGALPRFRIHEERDRHLIDAALGEDRAYSAYAIANLELGLFEHARFWVAEGSSRFGVVMHSESGLGRAMVTAGDPAAVDALLSLHPGPHATYLATGAPEHLQVLQRTYAVSGALEMQRMAVTAASFQAVDGEVRRLHREDARALNMLYSSEGAPTGYSGDHIEHGVYYGAYEAGRLVSVAGTHVVAPNTGVGVVGNVFTHPQHRGAGLATRVTSAVTEELLDRRGCTLVALTVNPANIPAVRAYRRLGYEPGAPVIEARLRRRDPLGLGAALRRWVAKRRAHGGEAGDEDAPGRGTI
jgi:ribosomal protein S18 acetylase RimI-like enzyme